MPVISHNLRSWALSGSPLGSSRDRLSISPNYTHCLRVNCYLSHVRDFITHYPIIDLRPFCFLFLALPCLLGIFCILVTNRKKSIVLGFYYSFKWDPFAFQMMFQQGVSHDIDLFAKTRFDFNKVLTIRNKLSFINF